MDGRSGLTLYPVDENEYIGKIWVPKGGLSIVETVVILDGSSSMGDTTRRFIHEIIPAVLKLISPNQKFIHLITFSHVSFYYFVGTCDLKTMKMTQQSTTNFAPAISKLRSVFEKLNADYPVRILTISDGEICDRKRSETEVRELLNFLKKSNFTINSQAVRLFTSKQQPDTKALSSLLQLNNTTACQLTDIGCNEASAIIANKIAQLFRSDNFDGYTVLKFTQQIVLRFPWDSAPSISLILFSGWNLIWLKLVPDGEIKMNCKPVSFHIEHQLTLSKFQELIDMKLSWILDHMKVLKVVNTQEAVALVKTIFDYFSKKESALALKCSTTYNLKISNTLAVVANNKNTFKNSAEMAEFLRSNSESQLQEQALRHSREFAEQRRIEQERVNKEKSAEEERLKQEKAEKEERLKQEKAAKEERLKQGKKAEEERLRQEKEKEEERLRQEKAAEEERLKQKKEAETERLRQEKAKEEERLRQNKSAEEERLKQKKEAEEERLKQEKEAELKRLRQEKEVEKQRLRREREIDEKRLIQEKTAEEERLKQEKAAEEERLKQQKEAEEERLKQEKAAEGERLKQEKAAEEERLKKQKESEEERLIQEKAAEEERLKQEKAAEEERLKKQKETEEERLRQEKEMEEKRLIQEKAEEEERLKQEKEAEVKRLRKKLEEKRQMQEKAAEEERLKQEKASEEERMKQQKKAEEERLRQEREMEEKRLIQEKAAEEERLKQEKAEEEERLKKQKEAEVERIRQEREMEEKRLIQEKAAEEERLKQEKAVEEERLNQQKEAEEERLRQEREMEEKRLIQEEEERIKQKKAAEKERLKQQKEAEEERLRQQREMEEKRLIQEKAAEEERLKQEMERLKQEKGAEVERLTKKLEEKRLMQEKAAKQERLKQLMAAERERLNREKLAEEKHLKRGKAVDEARVRLDTDSYGLQAPPNFCLVSEAEYHRRTEELHELRSRYDELEAEKSRRKDKETKILENETFSVRSTRQLHSTSDSLVLSMTESAQNSTPKNSTERNAIETVVIHDESMSETWKTSRINKKIIPMVLSKLNHNRSQLVHSLSFGKNTLSINKNIRKMLKLETSTSEDIIVRKFNTLLQTLDARKKVRILVLIDGTIQNHRKAEHLAQTFTEILGEFHFSANLQIVRLASNFCRSINATNCKVIEIDAKESNETISSRIAALFDPTGRELGEVHESDRSNPTLNYTSRLTFTAEFMFNEFHDGTDENDLDGRSTVMLAVDFAWQSVKNIFEYLGNLHFTNGTASRSITSSQQMESLEEEHAMQNRFYHFNLFLIVVILLFQVMNLFMISKCN
ncbi:Flagellar attachment zone protein 1 [Pseudolycoriella hygida]|uniref:Flagellar attachment zone protein 1 n=1 Tax=Pseudolycoriella hygida TaxID=35572 RepID=A0A9Q0N1E2_9DIPT|nr:Flagellar attachment zone protein 1 [Pseudolycoriella hygida]